MQSKMKTEGFFYMSWTIQSTKLTNEDLLIEESLFFTGNGYLGVRGNFEEGYSNISKTIRGTYINAFHDITDVTYGEKLHAFPETQQKLLNIIDVQTVKIALIENGKEEWLSLFDPDIKVVSYKRSLFLDKGYAERRVHYLTKSNREVVVTYRRIASFLQLELFAQEITIEPISFHGEVKIVSSINGDVSNHVDKNDPRVASGHAKRLHVTNCALYNDVAVLEVEAYRSKLKNAVATSYHLTSEAKFDHKVLEGEIETRITFPLKEKVTFTKTNMFTDTLRHGEETVEAAIKLQQNYKTQSLEQVWKDQTTYLNAFWETADIQINGDQLLQEGIRFNLYHLLQSAGRDKHSNISAKGLSGEGYEGHYFWDTEIYIAPVFLLTKPDLAKQLLIYRYSILDGARKRAKEMGHRKGALFPWRTISGSESSAYFPAGTAQYHISADIAYSYIQYYLATGDEEFLEKYGAEVLFETARLWVDTGHYQNGQFRIDTVTGPDEYTCIVNNNYYTNVMAKHNLDWAVRTYQNLQENMEEGFSDLVSRLSIKNEEIREWQKASEQMYLPYNRELDINPQDDTFLQKAVWNFNDTPADHYPLLLHYHPLTLYRYQVCKQADTVLAHFLLEDAQEATTIKNSFHYYEKLTTHDSSLSSCVFSIMAAKVGEKEKAYDYFIETARLDLDNTHGNTKDGLHMANMGGTWMAIVFGFAGLRIKETGLEFNPFLPVAWQTYSFPLQFQGRRLRVEVNQHTVAFSLTEGKDLSISVYGEQVWLRKLECVTLPLGK